METKIINIMIKNAINTVIITQEKQRNSKLPNLII